MNPSQSTFENEGSSFNNTRAHIQQSSNEKSVITGASESNFNGESLQKLNLALHKKDAHLKKIQSKLSTNYQKLL